MRVIGITGHAGAGKDTAALGLIGLGWERIRYSDAINDVLVAMDPTIMIGARESLALGTHERWNGSYTWTGHYALSELVAFFGIERVKYAVPEVRRLQQELGTAARRALGDDVLLDAVKRRMVPGGDYVITGVRKANEVADIHTLGGKVVKVVRPGYGPVNGHEIDNEIDSLDVDLCIQNVGAPWELKSELVKYATAEVGVTVAGIEPEEAMRAYQAALMDRSDQAYADDEVTHPLYERRGPRSEGRHG